MIRPDYDAEVYVCTQAVDFRKSIRGLSVLVEEILGMSPFERKIFVFTNRKQDRIKLLAWDRNGFVLYYKVLEKSRFPWIRERSKSGVTLSGTELRALLDGIDVFARPAHPALHSTMIR